mmetsp:Transcript_55140/g.135003  ORF Transcript_55140/g.135003 Transcript_55140/m.135003 type:complete len:456 (-) Transcript_55140:86-1453(-)
MDRSAASPETSSRGAASPEEMGEQLCDKAKLAQASLSLNTSPQKPSKDRQPSASPGEGGDRTASDGKGVQGANKREKGAREAASKKKGNGGEGEPQVDEFRSIGLDGVKAAAFSPAEGADESVSAMLKRIGLPQYTSLLESNDVDDTNWHFLDQQALEALGIGSWGHRVAISRAATQRRQIEEEEDVGFAVDGMFRGRKKGVGKGDSRGPGDMGNKHEDLKYVYEQMENIKMHFEAQIEQLNRELHATKDELASFKRSVATGVAGGSQVQVSGKQAAKFGEVDMNSGGNAGGKDGSKAGPQGIGGGGGSGSRGGKTQRRKENDDGYAHGGGGSGQYMRGGATGGAYGHNNQQGYNQNQMGFAPHMYQGMMHPGNMQYYYNNVGMHMQGGGYDQHMQGGGYEFSNSYGGGDGGGFHGGGMNSMQGAIPVPSAVSGEYTQAQTQSSQAKDEADGQQT